MNEKIIGVTPRFSYEGTTLKQSCNDNYLRALQKMGFTPIQLPIGIKQNDIILELCDGFLITGGTDILPKFFNQENNGSDPDGNEEMDLTDKVVIDYAVKNKKPMLGICRGHQAINVFLGGSLVQNIGTSHQNTKHTVKTKPNRLIEFPEIITVNSFHHQVLDKMAKDLVGIAYSEEGYCEALIHNTLPIFSVQWHPERMMDDEIGIKIFKKFRQLVDENSY